MFAHLESCLHIITRAHDVVIECACYLSCRCVCVCVFVSTSDVANILYTLTHARTHTSNQRDDCARAQHPNPYIVYDVIYAPPQTNVHFTRTRALAHRPRNTPGRARVRVSKSYVHTFVDVERCTHARTHTHSKLATALTHDVYTLCTRRDWRMQECRAVRGPRTSSSVCTRARVRASERCATVHARASGARRRRTTDRLRAHANTAHRSVCVYAVHEVC